MRAPTNGLPEHFSYHRTKLPASTAAFAAPGQRSAYQVPEANRATQAERQRVLTQKAKDGGTLSSTVLLCESRRRV